MIGVARMAGRIRNEDDVLAALSRIRWLLALAAGVALVGLAFGLSGFAGFDAIRPEWLSKLLGA